MSKKWYSYFVSVDGGDAPESSPEAGNDAAAAVAAIAKSLQQPASPATAPTPVVPAPQLAAMEAKAAPPPGGGPRSFVEIYQAAEIATPPHGYTIFKVADMMQSEHIRALPAEIKRSSVLVALEAAGVKINDVIQDAIRRDKALDTFETIQQRAVDQLETQKADENKKLQADADRVLNELRAKMQANNDAVAKERERFLTWRAEKQKEEQRIADAVAPFVSANPISTGPAATAAPAAPKPGA